MHVVVHHIGPSCVQCTQTKKLLTKMGVPFDEVDLRSNPDLVEKFKDLGHLAAPIVTVNGTTIWSGFRLSKLQELGTMAHLDKVHEQ